MSAPAVKTALPASGAPPPKVGPTTPPAVVSTSPTNTPSSSVMITTPPKPVNNSGTSPGKTIGVALPTLNVNHANPTSVNMPVSLIQEHKPSPPTVQPQPQPTIQVQSQPQTQQPPQQIPPASSQALLIQRSPEKMIKESPTNVGQMQLVKPTSNGVEGPINVTSTPTQDLSKKMEDVLPNASSTVSTSSMNTPVPPHVTHDASAPAPVTSSPTLPLESNPSITNSTGSSNNLVNSQQDTSSSITPSVAENVTNETEPNQGATSVTSSSPIEPKEIASTNSIVDNTPTLPTPPINAVPATNNSLSPSTTPTNLSSPTKKEAKTESTPDISSSVTSSKNSSSETTTNTSPTPPTTKPQNPPTAALRTEASKPEYRVATPPRNSKRKKPPGEIKIGETESDERKPKRVRTQTQPYQSPLPELAFLSKPTHQSIKQQDDKLIVFYKNEFLAVRNLEGSFYVCQAVQNIYRSSPKIKIRWLSQEKKDNKPTDDFTADFYDIIDFDCILTNLELNKLDKDKYALPPEERERAQSILKRALDVEKGVSEKPPVTEEHPDGLDVSLYKDESQLKKRKRKSSGKKTSGSEDDDDDDDDTSEEEEDDKEEPALKEKKKISRQNRNKKTTNKSKSTTKTKETPQAEKRLSVRERVAATTPATTSKRRGISQANSSSTPSRSTGRKAKLAAPKSTKKSEPTDTPLTTRSSKTRGNKTAIETTPETRTKISTPASDRRGTGKGRAKAGKKA